MEIEKAAECKKGRMINRLHLLSANDCSSEWAAMRFFKMDERHLRNGLAYLKKEAKRKFRKVVKLYHPRH